MSELNIGISLGSLDHVRLVTEGICKDEAAALVSQVESGLFTVVGLADVCLDDALYAEILASLLGSLDEVKVIGGVLIV